MTANFTRGILNASSWHGLEEVGAMADAAEMIDRGARSGAWPVALRFEDLVTVSGIKAPARGLVASYTQHPEQCLGVVGDRYRATSPEEWRGLVTAACAAGAKPTGAFSLVDGTKALATFEVGTSNGLKTQMIIADSFDGSSKLVCGFTSIRVVCCNTLAIAMRQDGDAMANLRHTASLETKVNVLRESIGDAIKAGEKMRAVYQRAERTQLPRALALAVFDRLWPSPDEKASKAEKTKLENAQRDAQKAMANPVNDCGPTLATLWNAATYLVDRTADGSTRSARGGADMLDSMLFGARGERIEEVRQVIVEVLMRDGTSQHMTVPQALAAGVPPAQTGRAILDDLMSN